MENDRLKIREVRIPCLIGVDAWEAETLQTVSVDLCIPINSRAAAARDALADTIDYRAVGDGVFHAHEGGRFKLLETFAESVAQWVLEHTAVAWVEVEVIKPLTATAAKTATLSIRRERHP